MGLRTVICSVLLIVTIADFANGQGYEGRRPRPVYPEKPPGCLPVMCALACDYGFQTDSQGCAICRCNPGPIVDPFPPTPITPCPSGTAIVRPARVCGTFTSTERCRGGELCSGGAADEPGYCCRPVPDPQNVHCPIDNNRCYNNQKYDACSTGSCGNGFKCCKQACGRRCVPANGELYRPPNRRPRPR